MLKIQTVTSSVTALVIGIFVLLAYGFTNATWNPPTDTPPNNNTLPPIDTSATDQVKLGGVGASAFKTLGTVWSPQYCDENGNNCMTSGGVPRAGEVGSLVFAMIAPTAPGASDTPSTNSLTQYNYGDTIEGIHLCPAGFWMTGGNSNNLATYADSSTSGTCLISLSGTYEVLGFSPARSTSLIPNSYEALTLFIKISDMCGVDMNSSCANSSLNGWRSIRDLVYSETGQYFDRIYNGTNERTQVCNLLSPGSSVVSYTNISYGQPGNNNVGLYSGSSWTLQYPATSYNSQLDSIVCSN